MIEVSQFVAYARFRAILVQKGYACVMWGGAATAAVHNSFLPRFVGAFPRAAEPFWWLRKCAVVLASRLLRRHAGERGDHDLVEAAVQPNHVSTSYDQSATP